MLHTNERIVAHEVGRLNLVEEPGKLSETRRVVGLSRDTFQGLDRNRPGFPNSGRPSDCAKAVVFPAGGTT
mgnify:CR=1 FL=1